MSISWQKRVCLSLLGSLAVSLLVLRGSGAFGRSNSGPSQATTDKEAHLSVCQKHADKAFAVERLKKSRGSRLARFLEGPGLDERNDESVTYAACKYRHFSNYKHFPHAMQQLYRCFAWWHANPHKQAVLLAPPSESTTPFLKGFLEMLQTVFDVEFDQRRNGRNPVRPIVDFEHTGDSVSGGYKMRSTADLAFMRDKVLQYKPNSQAAGCLAHSTLPKVTILNREEKSGRHLYNVHELQRILQDQLGLTVNIMSSFDGVGFWEQVAIMQQTDFLISPHGAQLTSIPFLPACAQVIEVFSPAYVTPHFYGSLTSVSGHSYSYIQTGLPEETRMESLEQRRESRQEHMCLSKPTMYEQLVPTLQSRIYEWLTCCAQRQPE